MKTEMWHEDFASLFKICDFCMRLNGSHPKIKRDFIWMIHFCLGMALTWSFSSLVLYSMYVSFRESHMSEICRQGTMLSIACVISFKYSVMLLHQRDTYRLIQDMNDDYKRTLHMSDWERKTVAEYIGRGVLLSKLWVCTAAASSYLFPMKAAALMTYYYLIGEFQPVMVIELVLPVYDERKYEPLLFTVLFVGTTLYAQYVATFFVSLDTLIPIMLLHGCAKFELANIQISHLFAGNEAEETKRRLTSAAKMLQDNYRFLNTIRTKFIIVFEFILKSTTVTVPIALYLILEDLKSGRVSLEFVSYLFGCLVHFYIPCYYSDMLIEKSISASNAVYSCGWEESWPGLEAGSEGGSEVRKMMMILMVRAQRPLALTTAFDAICLESYSEMCKTSYAIFNLINASVK